ncbi:MAG: ribosome-associated translation inhibitor RaiA [Anaerolineales bacterium]|nr:ribosome-associated translation inhibitor RaiA [Anaerolineales bacterium]
MSINVEIYGRNMDVTERIQKYVDTKIAKLDRYLPGIEEARVDVAYVKSARNAADRQVAQITVKGKGFVLRTEESADDIFAALDSAVDKMQRQIERYKGKRYRGRGDGKSAAEVLQPTVEAVMEEIEVLDSAPVIARRKRFLMTPMDEMEAIEQMNLLGHDNFFIFYNASTLAINVLYKRRDGTYGVIVPEIA